MSERRPRRFSVWHPGDGRFGDGRVPGGKPTEHPHGARAQSFPRSGPDGESEEPADLLAVQADDALIDAIAAGLVVAEPDPDSPHGRHDGFGAGDIGRDPVVAMLVAWRAELDAQPIPAPLDPDTAFAAVTAARAAAPRRRPARRRGYVVSLAAAAAVVVATVGGVTVGAGSAHPGDPLFAVTTVLYAQQAQSRQAAADLHTVVAQLDTALAAGDTTVAAQQLAHLTALVGVVSAADGAPMARAQLGFLAAELAHTPPGTPTDPSTPLPDGTPPPTGPTAAATPRYPAAPHPIPAPTGIQTPPPGPPGSTVDPRARLAPGPPTATPTPVPTSTPAPATPNPLTPNLLTPGPSTEGSRDPALATARGLAAPPGAAPSAGLAPAPPATTPTPVPPAR